MENNIGEFENTQYVSSDNDSEKVVSIGKYFGMTLLYFIPIVGLIICIVMSIVAKNKNIKNHARAMLIWLVLLLIIGGITIGVIVVKVTTFVKGTISQVEQYVETFEEMNELINSFDEISETLEQTENMGDVSELMEMFENGDYENLMDSFENSDFGDALNQLDAEKLEDIINQFTNGQ